MAQRPRTSDVLLGGWPRSLAVGDRGDIQTGDYHSVNNIETAGRTTGASDPSYEPLAKFKSGARLASGLATAIVVCILFCRSAHNNSRERFSQSSSLCCKGVLTPYPGQFCRQLLCFDDFTAEHCLYADENKYFTPKIRVGGRPSALR